MTAKTPTTIRTDRRIVMMIYVLSLVVSVEPEWVVNGNVKVVVGLSYIKKSYTEMHKSVGNYTSFPL